MATACTFCGSDVSAHDALSLEGADGPIGQFCNFACLSAHIDAENLVVDDACNWSPDADCC